MNLRRAFTFCFILGVCCGAFEKIKQVDQEERIITNDRDTELERTETEETTSTIVEETTDAMQLSPDDTITEGNAKQRLAEAAIYRTKQLSVENTQHTEQLIERLEDKLAEKIDLLTVSDIIDLMSEFMSQEEIDDILKELTDSGINEDAVVKLLTVKGRSEEDTETQESTGVEDYRTNKKLDTDLFKMCPTTVENPYDSSNVRLTMDEIEHLDELLYDIKVSTDSQLSVAFDWSLNGTVYANYSNIMFRLLFGDESVSRNFTLVLKLANFLSDKGLPSAQNILAFIYKTGYGIFNETDTNNTKPYPQKALTYYTFSALGGDVMSEMALGYRYQKGAGVTPSCATSLVYYQRVGQKILNQIGLSGGPALYKLRLSDGDDETTNSNTMNQDLVEFFQMLAHKGDTSSTNLLGTLFLQGTKGAARNVHTAIKYFELAAMENDETALVTLGTIYGDCTLKGITDYEKSIYYFKRAIESNSLHAKALLGFLHLVGLGVKQDFSLARQLIEPGMKANNGEAILYFGIMMYYGYGVSRNVDQALRYFIKASETGNLLAIYYLAKANADQAHELDPVKPCQTAVRLYKGVAERGHWSHLLMVAFKSYKEGDYTRAYLLYSYLAELGYEVAQSNTAFLLENHEEQLFPHLTNSMSRAFHQWTRSADQGSSVSKVRLGDYSYYGIGRSVDYQIAANEYKEAAKAQDPQAKFNMGYMYERGLGVAKDLPLAKRNYDECLTLEPDATIAVHLALLNLMMTSQFDWVASSINLPFSNVNPLTFLVSLIINWDIYLITILIMVLGLVYLMYKQHLAQHT